MDRLRVTIKMKASSEASGPLFGIPPQRRRLHPLAFLASIGVHACGIALVVLIGAIPTSHPVALDAVILPPKNEKLIWYVTKDRLPAVTSEALHAGKPKIEFKRAGQAMKAEGPKPGKQLIWQPAPKIQLEQEVPLPNLLAFVPKPARPEPRKFVPPERTKAVVETPRVLPEPAPTVVAPALPAALPIISAIPGPARPRPRDFVPPTAPAAPAGQPAVVLDAAPTVPAQTQGQPSVVVVGLDPTRLPERPLPEGARSARFSVGPESGPGGGERAAAIVVPGLNVSGSGAGSAVVPGPARKPPPPYHEPSTLEWSQAVSGKDSRRIARSMMSAALRPTSRVLAPLVESRFPNRPLYTTSFEVGADGAMEWVIWFAEQTTRNDQYATIRPPVPWTRVDTGADVALPAGRFAAAAVIDKGGQPGSVIVLSGGDEATKEIAAKLIAEWVFLPALRNGEPIAVDTLIEISFRRKP
jgi:hypothetical protein